MRTREREEIGGRGTEMEEGRDGERERVREGRGKEAEREGEGGSD